MPQCTYLDLLSSNHYIRVYDTYFNTYVSEATEAVDGGNIFTKTADALNYTLDGKIYAISESSKIYMEYDMADEAKEALSMTEAAMKNGTNMKDRVYQKTVNDIIPVYSDHGDTETYKEDPKAGAPYHAFRNCSTDPDLLCD